MLTFPWWFSARTLSSRKGFVHQRHEKSVSHVCHAKDDLIYSLLFQEIPSVRAGWTKNLSEECRLAGVAHVLVVGTANQIEEGIEGRKPATFYGLFLSLGKVRKKGENLIR